MLSPCYGCPKRAEHDEWDRHLERVILTKGDDPIVQPKTIPKAVKASPVVPMLKTKLKPGPKKKKNIANPRPKKALVRELKECKMGGCDRVAVAKGYCQACKTQVTYYEKLGRPIPTTLSAKSLERRAKDKRVAQ